MGSITSPAAGADRPLADRLRARVALALRERVAGQDNAAKAALIWDTPGERWFTASDPIWRVHADAWMFAAGIRALHLQSLHPLAMVGVAGHSGYQGDPWGRLQRTSTFLATTTFGTIADAQSLIAAVSGIHERVRGRAPDGRPYAARDPHLLKWVRSCLSGPASWWSTTSPDLSGRPQTIRHGRPGSGANPTWARWNRRSQSRIAAQACVERNHGASGIPRS